MPQINLLGQNNRPTFSLGKSPLYLVRLFIVIFIGLLVYWAYLFVQTKFTTKQVATTQDSIIKTQKSILADENRKKLLVKQGQLRAANTLITEEEFWSRLLPELARVTLKSASYISFSATANGIARVSVAVPSYKDFDQFLQVFDLPEFNSHFSHITVSQVGKYQQGDVQSVRFDMTLQYDSGFLKGAAKDNTSTEQAK